MRKLIIALVLAAATCHAPASLAQTYPSRPITMIVPLQVVAEDRL